MEGSGGVEAGGGYMTDAFLTETTAHNNTDTMGSTTTDEEKRLSSTTPSPHDPQVNSGPDPAPVALPPPPDGGMHAWLCVAGSFLMQFVQFGLSE